MERRAYEDVAAAAAAHSELGHEYEGALAEGLVERISSEINQQVDARLEQRGVQPTQAAWANVVMGLGSVGLGIGATAVTLHALSTTGTTPKDSVVVGPFHATVNATTSSVSTAQVILVVLIWVVIAVVNIAYARRRPGGFGRLFAVHHAKPLPRRPRLDNKQRRLGIQPGDDDLADVGKEQVSSGPVVYRPGEDRPAGDLRLTRPVGLLTLPRVERRAV